MTREEPFYIIRLLQFVMFRVKMKSVRFILSSCKEVCLKMTKDLFMIDSGCLLNSSIKAGLKKKGYETRVSGNKEVNLLVRRRARFLLRCLQGLS